MGYLLNLGTVLNLAPLARQPSPSIGDPNGDRFLVDIQSNELAKLRHELSSSMRLCASVLTLKRNP